jgi:hypothetical protein
MDKNEIMRRIRERVDQDDDFAGQLGEALEAGVWEIVFDLISQAVGYIVEKASELWDWLKRNW